jgi:hypothetical protein
MAMGRQGQRQGDLMLAWDELPRSPGHPFYDKLQEILDAAKFDAHAEQTCQPWAVRVGVFKGQSTAYYSMPHESHRVTPLPPPHRGEGDCRVPRCTCRTLEVSAEEKNPTFSRS